MASRHVITTADGVDVVAVHHDAPSTDWMVFCHGFRSDKSGSYEGRCRRAVEEGYNAVRFDFRGCGESGGDFADGTLGGRMRDLAAVLERFDPDSVVLFGSSFGGKVALHAAVGDDRVRAVVTRAPVTYADAFDGLRAEVEDRGGPADGADAAVDARFFADLDERDFREVEDGLHCPVAIFHGGSDDSVPVEHSATAAVALPVDVSFQKYESEGHRFSRAAEDLLRRRTFEWLETIETT